MSSAGHAMGIVLVLLFAWPLLWDLFHLVFAVYYNNLLSELLFCMLDKILYSQTIILHSFSSKCWK